MLFLYNDKKQFTGLESYDKDGVFQGSSKITYNDKGKILNATFFDKDKKSNYNFNRKYEYDTKGNWLKTVSRDILAKLQFMREPIFILNNDFRIKVLLNGIQHSNPRKSSPGAFSLLRYQISSSFSICSSKK